MRSFGWVVGFAAAVGYVAGCNGEPAGKPYSETEKGVGSDEHAGHEHEHGPHEGHVVELTDDHSIHGEFVVDAASKQAMFYVTAKDLKTPVLAEAVQFHAETADGKEQTIDFKPVGDGAKASEFAAPLAELPSEDMEKLLGHFHVTVAGKELSGDLTHDHGDHEHP